MRQPATAWPFRFRLALLSLILIPDVALAQTPAAMPIEQVRDCICQQQRLESASTRLNATSTAYSQRQQELQRTEQDLAELQRGATPGDETAVAKAQALIDRRNLLRDQLRRDYPPYQALASDYNQRVERYNATCTTLPMLSFDVAAAKENLACPNP